MRVATTTTYFILSSMYVHYIRLHTICADVILNTFDIVQILCQRLRTTDPRWASTPKPMRAAALPFRNIGLARRAASSRSASCAHRQDVPIQLRRGGDCCIFTTIAALASVC